MNTKRNYGVVYDDRGRRHWQAVGEAKEEIKEAKKLVVPLDFSKALEARTEFGNAGTKIGKIKVDPQKQDLDKVLGFQCKLCEFSAKDNHTWMDHLNSVEHNRRIGNHMKVEKVTSSVVEDHLNSLRHKKVKTPAPKLSEILSKLSEGDPKKKMKLSD